jgi:uncharacterized protein (TIGR02118 family)
MSKIIFIHHRKPGITRAEMNEMWGSDIQLALVSKLPGITKWIRNEVVSPEGDEALNDGIGELWFEDDASLQAALESPEWKQAVEDARRYADLDKSGAIIVLEKPMF